MQTFLPYDDLNRSLCCLDYRRLGKQRVEAKQILNALDPNFTSGWRNHPAVLMWSGFEECLKLYHNLSIDEWVRRGYRNNMVQFEIGFVEYPGWFGDEHFHKSHQSNLLRKDPIWYGQYNWNVPNNLPYVWPILVK